MTDIKKIYWTASEIAEELNEKTKTINNWIYSRPFLKPKKKDVCRKFTEEERDRIVEFHKRVREQGFKNK